MELTILEQCCLHTAPVRTNLLLSGLFEIHPQDTIPNVVIHQILPYLLVFKVKTHHIYISNSYVRYFYFRYKYFGAKLAIFTLQNSMSDALVPGAYLNKARNRFRRK